MLALRFRNVAWIYAKFDDYARYKLAINPSGDNDSSTGAQARLPQQGL